MQFNRENKLAYEMALFTNKSFFLTGKAGTGKTTLLQKIVNDSPKNTVIVAPSGVAAINAGGVTIHSFCQLPPATFVPTSAPFDPNVAINRTQLFHHFNMRKDKREVIQQLDLLIIDEISMVRADILDAMDAMLKYVRRSNQPFGGVQLMVIGDLYQLPPVVRNSEVGVIQQFYDSPFFYSSQVWQKLNASCIELKNVYRQKDDVFIDILNAFRTNEDIEQKLEQLHNLVVVGDFEEHQDIIQITTHNKKADLVNTSKMEALKGEIWNYSAQVKGDFSPNQYPVEEKLGLKVGAKVMFIKNDSEEKRYFNGKIVTIIDCEEDGVWVKGKNETEAQFIQAETWENNKYSVNDDSGEIEREHIGSYSQLPFRLAWAVTIHKSQGLTFDELIIDAADSFSAGQVYVALSRCTSLDGIYLKSEIPMQAVKIDARTVGFMQSQPLIDQLEGGLEDAKQTYAKELIVNHFNWDEFLLIFTQWNKIITAKDWGKKAELNDCLSQCTQTMYDLRKMLPKFQNRLQFMFEQEPDVLNGSDTKEQCQKAADYFGERIEKEVIEPFFEHLKKMRSISKMKTYFNKTEIIWHQLYKEYKNVYRLKIAGEEWLVSDRLREKSTFRYSAKSAPSSGKKTAKQDTKTITLELFKEGKSIAEIAEIRELKESTIGSHFSHWIGKGIIDIQDLMNMNEVRDIISSINANSFENTKAIFDFYKGKYSYEQLRWVYASLPTKEK